MRSVQNDITTKKRPKFGVFWVLFADSTGGLGIILWLIWPRHNEVIGVDRYLHCTACNARV